MRVCKHSVTCAWVCTHTQVDTCMVTHGLHTKIQVYMHTDAYAHTSMCAHTWALGTHAQTCTRILWHMHACQNAHRHRYMHTLHTVPCTCAARGTPTYTHTHAYMQTGVQQHTLTCTKHGHMCLQPAASTCCSPSHSPTPLQQNMRMEHNLTCIPLNSWPCHTWETHKKLGPKQRMAGPCLHPHPHPLPNPHPCR